MESDNDPSNLQTSSSVDSKSPETELKSVSVPLIHQDDSSDEEMVTPPNELNVTQDTPCMDQVTLQDQKKIEGTSIDNQHDINNIQQNAQMTVLSKQVVSKEAQGYPLQYHENKKETDLQHGVCQPEKHQHGACQPEKDQHGVCQPEKDLHGVCQPGKDKHGVCQPEKDLHGVCQPGKDKHGVCQPKKDQQGVCQPEKDQQGVCQPGKDKHGVCQPEVDQQMFQPEMSSPQLYGLSSNYQTQQHVHQRTYAQYPQVQQSTNQYSDFQNESGQFNKGQISTDQNTRQPWHTNHPENFQMHPPTGPQQQTIPGNDLKSSQNRFPGYPVRLHNYDSVLIGYGMPDRYINSPPPPYSAHERNPQMPSIENQRDLEQTFSENLSLTSIESFVVIDESPNLHSEEKSPRGNPPLRNDFPASENDDKVSFLANQMNKAPVVEPGEMQLDRDISDSKGSNIIEVSNLPSNETVETITIFFRKKKVTGVSDAKFKILSHNNQRKRALLEFEDKEVVSRLLKKKELKLHDEIVTILPHKAAADDKNPSKQLKVMGFSSSTSTDTILMYFESKKKSGGVAESVNFDHFDDERYVIVSYDTVEDIDKVLSVEHRLDGHNLELTIFEPEPVPSVENTIQVTGFKDTTSFDTLELYFESKKKSGAEAEKVELNKDCLYVTYCSNEDIEIVLNKTHEIEGNKLDVKKLEATVDLPIIEVTGFKDTTSFDTLELYFESKKNSGAEAEKVELNKDKDSLYVTYKSIEECDLVLSREHEMENCTLILKKHLGTKEKEKRKNENSSSVGNDIMVKLSGFKSTLNETKLQNYIENENKFGAVASSIQFDSDERCVFVTLSSAKDAEKVCGKHHNVGKETFHISIFTPSPTWNDRFLISNLSEDTSVHKLKHYLEGKLECDVIRTLYSDAEDKAIVYCGSNQYDTVFSKADILAKKKLDGKTLTISPVYKSKIAQVSGFTPDIDCEDLELYFEKKKKSNGGEVDKVELNKEDMYALVHFDKYEDVCNVCQTDHELEGSKLDVKEYQKCLGIFGGIEDPDNFNQPEPQLISLDDIEQGKLDFIYQTPENQNDFETKMQQLDTVVDWDKQKQIVVMRLSLPSKVQKGRKRAKKWMKNHQSFFKDYMKTISHEEIKLLTEVIELVAIDLKQPQTKKDLIVKFSDSIIIIGWMSDIFNSFIGDIKKLINKIETDLERKKKELVETLSFKYSYAVLEQFGIMKIVQDSSGKLKISSHNSDTEVQFKGTVSEINSAKALIYEKEQTLKSKMLTDYDMSPMIMQLLLKPEVKKHIIESILKDDKEFAIWEGEVLKGKETGSLQVVAKDQPSLDKIIDIFKKSISHVVHELDPESSHLLTDKKWQTFIDGIYDQYEAFVKIIIENPTKIVITCISDIIECVMPEIKSFFDTNTTYSRSCKLLRGHDLFIKKYFGKDLQELAGKLKVKITMDEETVGIKVEGTKGKIQEILDAVEKYRKSIECREKNIGEKMSKKFLDSEKGLEVIKSIQGQFRCIILKEKEDIIEAVNEGKELGIFEINNTTIKVIKDDITTLSVDVIVNAANERLAHIGGVAGAISSKGGASIQQECNEYVYRNGSVLEGDCMIGNAGNLPCRKIVHAVGPRWRGGRCKEDKKLAEVILRTLEMVMTYGFKSVAIPAISSGIFGYPLQSATDVIVQSIARHFNKVNRSSITTIYLIDISDKSLHSFIRSLQSSGDFQQVGFDLSSYGQEPRFTHKQGRISEREFEDDDISGEGAYSLPVVESPPISLFKPTLTTGEIAKVSADVIVNSTSSNLQLQNGAVSGSIIKAGGPSLQQECNEKYSNGIQVGDIAVTSGGNLKCKKVYHTCLGQYVQGAEKSLQKLILKCLKSAEKSKFQSIAFPAIGTGNLGYPKDIVAKTFYDTVNEYGVNGGRIKNINIVVYGGDAASVKAFQRASIGMQEPIVRPKESTRGKKKPVIEEREEDKWIFVTSNEMVKGIDVGKFKLIVRCGDILSAKVPIIVDSTDKYLSSGGTVSQAIYKVYGKEIKKNKTPAEKEMSERGIAVTPLDNSKQSYIIHVDGDRFKENWKKAISLCLKEADTLKQTSMAFPALGTGIHRNSMETMAETFHKALSENSNLNYLKTVEIIIFQSNDLDRFINGFTKALNQKNKSKKGLWGSFISYIKGDDSDDGYEMDYEEFDDISPPVVPLPTKDLNDVSLSIYSDDTHEITKAMEQLDISIKLDVQDLQIGIGDVRLTEIQKRKIFLYEDSHSVVVKIDERLDTIVIRGLMADIVVVSNGVNSILRNALTKEHEEKFSIVLKDVIQWSWLENGQRKEYLKFANNKIEGAFIKKDVDFKLKYSNEKLTFDFNNMEVKDERGNANPLLRQDKVKEATEASGTPTDWKITATSNLNIVQLNSTSKEYQQVESNFKQTLGGQNIPVVKIERIENRSVYQQYMAKKKHMELELKSLASTIEQPVLWHGTDQQAVHNINNYGFNRSYCGKNATMYGQGVYFAVNSSYSVRYARGTTGQRQMYQCKVLVGQYAQGHSSYRVPPAKPGTSSTYESVVDNINNPSMYVIFHDTQAYPEYLITF